MYRFIVSFLQGRYQKVCVNGSFSEPYKTLSGVPQGSCLGPLLFILYINDLPNCLPPNVYCTLYADDCKLYTINSPHSMQLALNAVFDWSKKWQMDISFEKTFVMLVGRRHPSNCRFLLGDSEVKITKSFTDLGITYSNNLCFDDHIAKIAKQAYKRSNFILRAFRTRRTTTLFQLFRLYVRPLLEYSTPIWSPSKKHLINTIENVQRSYLKRAFARAGILNLTYREQMSQVNATTLEFRRLIFDQLALFKIVHGIFRINMTSLIKISSFVGRTRGHELKIETDIPRTQQYHDCFLQRSVRLWNTLPTSIVLSSTTTAFAAKLEKSLRAQGLY